MFKKSTKSGSSNTPQQTTRRIESPKTVSKPQKTTSGSVSSCKSKATADRAISPASATTAKIQQPVPARIAPVLIIQKKSSSLGKNGLLKVVEEHSSSCGHSEEKDKYQPSLVLGSNERTKDDPVSSWKSPPVASASSPSISSTSTSTSSTNTSFTTISTSDTRVSRSATSSGDSRFSSSTIEKYDLGKPAYVLIFRHLLKRDQASIRADGEHEPKLLEDILKSYNAKIADICEDCTVAQVEKQMNEVRAKNLDSYSSLIVIVISNGALNDKIQTKDGFYQLDNAIIEPTLMNDTLKGKPKLFFVQACKSDEVTESSANRTATNNFDVLKCISIHDGSTAGHRFIETLFELFMQNPDKEITDTMRLMRNAFSICQVGQAPAEISTLTKGFFFNDLKKL